MRSLYNHNLSKYLISIKEQFPLPKIRGIVDSLETKKILIIGDTIIDEYCFVEPKGRAMKDPILSVEFREEEAYAGGILAIANHISTFVNEVTVVTVLGDDLDKKDFILRKLSPNIHSTFFVKRGSPTTRKKRYVNKVRNEKLFKIEYINDSPINQTLENDIIAFLKENAPHFDLVVVGDFGHGFINENIIKVLEQKAKFLAVNAQTNSANFGFNYVTKYNSPSFISMDGTEIKYAVGDQFSPAEILINKLFQMKNFKRFLVTLGGDGVAYFNQNKISRGPALASKVTDVVGAGDAVFSIVSLLVYSGAEDNLIPFIANSVGGIKVNIMGNKESVTKEKLFGFIEAKYQEVEDMEINQYFGSVNTTLNNLNKTSINSFVRLLLEAYYNDKTIYIFGNGGSAATASHFCGDLVKGVSYSLGKRFRAICLNDNTPALMAIANDISYDDIFVEQLKNFANKEDLVIGISGSGNSRNVIKALEYAKIVGAKTIAICGFKGGEIKNISDLAIHAEVDDMEISEDIHNLIVTHCVKRMLAKELNNQNYGEQYSKRIS